MLRLIALSALVLVAGCVEDPAPGDSASETPVAPKALTAQETAVADISPIGDGTISGTVTFTQLGDAVEVRYDLSDIASDGDHGMHVHETGDCGPDSTGTPGAAAGGHFNPLAASHGAPSARPSGRHAGDLGNIVAEGGRATGTRIDSVLALKGPTSVIGRSMIIHAGRDDLESQPSGDAGARVGCGVIRAGTALGADSTAISSL